MAQFPHLLASCTRHRLMEVVAAVRARSAQPKAECIHSRRSERALKIGLRASGERPASLREEKSLKRALRLV